MAWRTVGRDRPSRAASSISLPSRLPGVRLPCSMAASSCWESWKYSGTGELRSTRRSSDTVGSTSGFGTGPSVALCPVDGKSCSPVVRTYALTAYGVGPHFVSMRIGVIGTGRIGTLHARTLKRHREVGSLILTDTDPARAQALAHRLGETAAPG